MLARPAAHLTPREQFPTFSQSRVKSFRIRSYLCGAIPALVTPSDSALAKRDACNSFRFRSYEKCRVSLPANSHFGIRRSPLAIRQATPRYRVSHPKEVKIGPALDEGAERLLGLSFGSGIM